MKLKLTGKTGIEGSILIITLAVGFLLGLGLCSYLVLVNAQDRSVARSQRWNASLDMAEAGIEEALAQVNSSTNFSGSINFAANGWSPSGNSFGPVTRNLAGGFYSVMFTTNPTPTVYSTGYVATPYQNGYVQRHVKLTTMSLPLINVPLGAVYNINMNGNGAATDSWNSYDTNLSVNGQYNASKISSNGSVASVDGVVNIGNHTILGNLYLGPGATYSSGTNQVTGQIYYDYNVVFPDAALPNYTWWPAPVTNSVHDFTLANTLLANTFSIIDNYPIVVEPGVKVTLRVQITSFNPGSLSILGGSTNSGTLTIYQDSGTASINGGTWGANGGPGFRAEDFYYFGLPGVTSITLSGNSTFLGVIYAPEAALTLNGGGNANNLIGSAIVKSVTLNGHYDFHFDMALLTNGPVRGYIAGSWQEF